MPDWIADRTKCFDSSGIRKVFDLGAKLENPINLSIGQPDFDVPIEVREAAIDAIQSGKNGYALTQGMPVLREKLQKQVDEEYGHNDRQLFVTSGTSGGLLLAMMALVNPGDEVLVFDPYFVMYDALAAVVGGKVVYVNTYPDFRIDLDRVADAITSKTKLILFNSPANPTGVVASEEEVRGLAQLAAEREVVLLSDEIYRSFCYDGDFVSPAQVNAQTLVIDGFSKSHGMPGWRLGFAHGPSEIIQQMIKLQQYSFVCAPQTGSMGRRGCDGHGHHTSHRSLSSQAGHAARRAERSLRHRPARRIILCLPQGSLGHGGGVCPSSHRKAQVVDYPRQRLQPREHALPHLLCRYGRDD